MNLIAVKDFFAQNPVASAVEVAAHFNVTPPEITCYLTYWEHRGKLAPCNKACDNGCNLCYQHDYTYYTWKG